MKRAAFLLLPVLAAAALKLRGNALEIEVTDPWRNRLIGDEQEPADCEFEKAPFPGGECLVRYPAWFAGGIARRPAKGRRCFTAWNYFRRDSAPTPSGLLRAPELRWRAK
ncbi:MAG: hypothetical protein J6T01_01405 [Kiritimatiellae bacterium]|nr:hypothetical protein [Kiritimatiellia bacterium]